MGLLKETLSSGGAIRTGEIEIVDDGQGIQLAMADTMQAMMSKCKLAVAAFNAGTGTLKDVVRIRWPRTQSDVCQLLRAKRGESRRR